MVRPINGIVAAGDFTLDVAKLLTSAGIEIDIKANIMLFSSSICSLT